jgi:N-acetylneuraminic acid mutarotase
MFKPSKWKLLKPVGDSPEPRCGHSSIIMNEENLYILGGNETLHSHFKIFSKLYEYNISSNSWRNIQIPKIPAKIGDPFILFEGHIYCVTSSFGQTARIDKINVKTGEWKKYSTDSRHGSTSTKSILYGGKILTFGGFRGPQMELNNDILEFDIKSKTWDNFETTGDLPCPRSLYSCVQSKNKMVQKLNSKFRNSSSTEVGVMETM